MATSTTQRSALKDFLSSIATIKGDLSNITAPPFVLASSSTTTLPSYWAENPTLFTAPATLSSPSDRALAVLKWFLLSLLRQQYGGRPPAEGVKKPLNAFLGELYLAKFDAGQDSTYLVAEQVSHHPPVTACSLRADGKGVRADGFAGQRITFSGSVEVRQMGHAILTLTEKGEEWVIPLPEVKVSGILTGAPYPELQGRYVIPGSSGWRSVVDFSGKKVLGLAGERHHVKAEVFGPESGEHAEWTVEGVWDGKMVVKDREGKEVDVFDATELKPVAPTLPSREEQSPWETRRAWGGVADALEKGDMQGAADAKSVVEEAQRAQRTRREESGQGEEGGWEPLFFRKVDRDERWEKLKDMMPAEQRKGSEEQGFWVVDEKNRLLERPFRDGKPWEA
ncbi:Oxysterol-binding protein [Myriangium duriaei CBS 260.36]|uniref:Oxysterol-binding protein n=1 Tax=Myriangium duriaei CBS 260.36 TaxID=1168546 RepID=A0A9P4MPS0_9PEZI|nr:Oxysterol-binding protein [Myriangium duriaei CBS 260.36]